jgi:hypothetical protein
LTLPQKPDAPAPGQKQKEQSWQLFHAPCQLIEPESLRYMQIFPDNRQRFTLVFFNENGLIGPRTADRVSATEGLLTRCGGKPTT